MRAVFVRKCFAQLFSRYVLAKKALTYEKRVRKMLVKLIAPNTLSWQIRQCVGNIDPGFKSNDKLFQWFTTGMPWKSSRGATTY